MNRSTWIRKFRDLEEKNDLGFTVHRISDLAKTLFTGGVRSSPEEGELAGASGRAGRRAAGSAPCADGAAPARVDRGAAGPASAAGEAEEVAAGVSEAARRRLGRRAAAGLEEDGGGGDQAGGARGWACGGRMRAPRAGGRDVGAGHVAPSEWLRAAERTRPVRPDVSGGGGGDILGLGVERFENFWEGTLNRGRGS